MNSPRRHRISLLRVTAVAVGAALCLSIVPGVSSPNDSVVRAESGYIFPEHSCAIVLDGQVLCWGSGYAAVPILISGISTATSVAVTTAMYFQGGEADCAVLADHTVRCWAGPTGTWEVPGISTAIAVTAGGGHTCAVLADGTVRCWGWNQYGQLGDGTTADSSVPVAVSGINTATAISAGEEHTCAILANGILRCWGQNDSGQLGIGTSDVDPHPTPVAVSGINAANGIAAGVDHTCAVVSDHTVRCWGDNSEGQLGDGTTTTRLTPVSVGGITNATAVAAGGSRFTSTARVCAILADRTVRCWGTHNYTPEVVPGIKTARAISVGPDFACVVLTDRTPWCWGNNDAGQLGDGTTTDRPTPVAVLLPNTPFADIAGSIFKPDIEWAYWAGITSGCTPIKYCPESKVTREQMASFLARALGLVGAAPDAFTDDEQSIHEPNINLVAQAGITLGCTATTYCPKRLVPREQMASFLARALGLVGDAPDAFTDDESSIHEPNINLVAKAGVATGCGTASTAPRPT